MSTGAAEVTFKSSTFNSIWSWADTSNDQQSGLYDNCVRYDVTAVQEASETTCPVSRHPALDSPT